MITGEVPTPEAVAAKFERLAAQWREQTGHLSRSKAFLHPSYLAVMRMGAPVVPVILRSLVERPEYWSAALYAITEENPVAPEDAGKVDRIAATWVRWGRERGILPKEACPTVDPRYETVVVRRTDHGFVAAVRGPRRRSGAADSAAQSLLALARTYCLTGDDTPSWLPEGATFRVLVNVEDEPPRCVVGAGATFPAALIAATDQLLD